jgi:hypothetical protein
MMNFREHPFANISLLVIFKTEKKTNFCKTLEKALKPLSLYPYCPNPKLENRSPSPKFGTVSPNPNFAAFWFCGCFCEHLPEEGGFGLQW